MALHIQMTEEAEESLRKARLRNKISSVLACLTFMGIAGSILYFTYKLIMPPQEPAMVAYVPEEDNAPPNPRPKTKQVTRKTSSSQNVAPSVIVADTAAPVAMAIVDVPVTDSEFGIGLNEGLGVGIGDGIGGSGGEPPMGSSQKSGSALEGTFYDLKQTRGGASTGIVYNAASNNIDGAGRNMVAQVLGEFMRNWSPAVLNKYYQAKQKLYASTWYLPNCSAIVGPLCFNQANVKPSAWVVVYRGKVKAPKTGKFRFVGAGDDVIAVRFNNKLVLEAGWAHPSMYDPKQGNAFGQIGEMGTRKEYQEALKAGTAKDRKGWGLVNVPNAGSYNGSLGGLTKGAIIDVKEGRDYPIEILISEIPGGAFGMLLMMQDMENNSGTFDLFRTSFAAPKGPDTGKSLQDTYDKMPESYKKLYPRPGGMGQFVPYNEDSLIWPAVL